MADDRYIELMEDAKDALYALLKDTEPGTGLTLHHAYAEIKRTLDKERPASAPEKVREEVKAPERAPWEYAAAWRRTPWHARERLLLEALTDDTLTTKQIAKRINDAHDELDLYAGNLQGLIGRMVDAGEIEKVQEPWRGRYRNLYRRKAGLDGTIADLNRALESEGS